MGSQIPNSMVAAAQGLTTQPRNNPLMPRHGQRARGKIGGEWEWQKLGRQNGPREMRACWEDGGSLGWPPQEMMWYQLCVPGLSGDNRFPYWKIRLFSYFSNRLLSLKLSTTFESLQCLLKNKSWGWGCSSAVERLPSTCEALVSILSAT